MDDVEFPLWNEKGSRPSPQYGFLLNLIVHHIIYFQRKHNPLEFSSPTPHYFTHPFKFLIDLCWNDLPLLGDVVTKLAIPRPQHQQYPSSWQPDSKDVKLIRDFLYPLGWTQEDALATDIAYLSKLDWYRRVIMGIQDEKLKNYEQILRESYNRFGPRFVEPSYDAIFRHWNLYESHLQKRFKNCLDGTGQKIEEFLNANRYRQHENHSSDAINEVDLATEIHEMKTTCESLVLFAVSGSGKTRSIERLLSRHFGIYCQACFVPLQSQGVHSAQRISGSKDTLSLGKMIGFAQSIHQGAREVGEASWVTNWLSNLIDYRIAVFAQYLTIAKKLTFPMGSLPRLWFELQVSNEVDLFDEGFQLACLTNIPSTVVNNDRSSIKEQLGPGQIYFCLDEAQADIDAQIPDMDGTVPLLQLWARVVSDLIEFGWPIHSPVIYSGTSLSTKEAVKAVKYGGYSTQFDEYRSSRPSGCYTFSTFPAIRGEKQFKEVMEKHGMLKIGEGAIEIVVEYARSFYGRPKWSIRYLKYVNDVLSPDSSSSLSDSALREKMAKATDDAMQEVKVDLRNRLCRLESQGLEKLMENLCRVVVWSDLLDQPTPFWDKIGPTLIQEAFAVVKSQGGQSQYFLEEKLALDAAKEFFLIERPELGKRWLGGFLQEQANAVSSLGKAAECFLAWNLYRIFVNNDERLLGSKEEDRLPQLLRALHKAQPLDDLTQDLNLTGYTLLQGKTIGHTYDGSVEMTRWMELVRNSRQPDASQPNATFFFPENNVGPDLMFALSPSSKEPSPSSNEQDIILCLLQLKCGDAEPQKGIMSTNLSKAYRSAKGKEYSDKCNALKKELRACSKSKLRILRVLVTASVHAAKGERGNLTVERGSPCREYFIRCDAKQTKLLFGDEFQVLLTAVRSGNKSLSDIYRHLHVDKMSSKHRRGSNDESIQRKKWPV